MGKQVSINLEELPLRSRPLQPSELSKVFGGCKGITEICEFHSDCCAGACYGGGVTKWGQCAYGISGDGTLLFGGSYGGGDDSRRVP